MGRVAAIILLGVTAVSVAFHGILSPIYPESIDVGTIWDVLVVLQVASLAVVLCYSYTRRSSLRGGPVLFLLAAFAILLYVQTVVAWNAPDRNDAPLLAMFYLLNPLIVVLSGLTAACLWREGRE